jgi:hypothetical protein
MELPLIKTRISDHAIHRYIIFKHPVAARKNDVLFIFSLHGTLFYINKNCVFYYITLHVSALSAIIRYCWFLLITLRTLKTISYRRYLLWHYGKYCKNCLVYYYLIPFPNTEFQENSAIPQPIETAIVTHGVKNHKRLGTAIPLLASLLINLRKKLMECRRPTWKMSYRRAATAICSQ